MRFFRSVLIPSVMTLLLCACTPAPPAGNASPTAANANQPAAANSHVAPTRGATPPAAATNSPGTGNIDVDSAPAGARILLIPVDEGGASVPQVRGATPATITGLSPGKYAVSLEKPGYKSYQKEVVVKADSTTTVKAKLRQ